MVQGTIRLCSPRYDDLYRVTADQRVTGMAAPVLQLLLDSAAGLNVSFQQPSSTGVLVDPVSQVYDGCIGSIQRNESDIMFYGFVTYPVVGANLTNRIVCGAEKLGVMSGYNAVESSRKFQRVPLSLACVRLRGGH